jgi:uncharacterized protein YrrD
MIKSRELMGLPLIAKTTGKRVGEFQEIIFDPDSFEVLGITLGKNENPEKKKVVLFKDIIKFEDQQILIKSQNAVIDADKVAGLPDVIKENQKLLSETVKSENEKEIGAVSDVLFDEKMGEVAGFELADGLIKDIMEGRRFIPLSQINVIDQKVVVSQEVAESLEPSIGGLKKILRIEEERG